MLSIGVYRLQKWPWRFSSRREIDIVNVWLNRLINSSFNILLSETESKPNDKLWRKFISVRMVGF